MRTLNEVAMPFEFPVLIWTDDFLRVSESPGNLFVVSPAGAKEMASQASEQWHLLDANGRRFDITGWERIEAFGGWETFFERLFRYVFQVPILANERQLSIDDAKQTIMRAAHGRYQYDLEPYEMADIEQGLAHASTHLEALKVVRKVTEPQ